MGDRQHWQPDEAATHCGSCKRKFDIVNRKHHCRLCGHVFCDDCSRWTVNVRELDITNGRACEPCSVFVSQKLPLLTRETIFQKADADGSTYEVRLKVSPDQDFVLWRSEKFQFGLVEQLELDTFRKVVMGQQTPLFASAQTLPLLTCCLGPGIAKYEDRSFSLVFADNDTIDLVALSVDAMDGWLDAFRELVARRSSSSSATIKDVVRREQQAAEQQAKREIKSKYASKSAQLKSKYGTTT